MKTTTDTNVLVRLFVEDDPAQTSAARALLEQADAVIVPTSALCELVWVLRAIYQQSREATAQAVEKLMLVEKVVLDSHVAEVGIASLRSGCDFADGVIAAEGAFRGGEVFASFDRHAVARLGRLGLETLLVDGDTH